jgi:hypothetical protein
MNSQLDQIRALIKANELSLARDELKKFLAENAENAQGWFLASFVQSTPEMRLASIRRAATLQPEQLEIQERLRKLESAVEKKKGIGLSAFAIIIGVLLVALISTLVLVNQNTSPSQNELLPTLAVLLSTTDIPVRQTNATTTSVSVLQPETTLVGLQATNVSSTIEPTIEPTIQTVVTSLATSTPIPVTSQLVNPPSTAYPDVTTVITPTLASNSPTAMLTPTLSGRSTVTAPTAIPTSSQSIPLHTTINIAAGEFRIVDAKRGAESMIQDLGGSFIPAPANQSWLLLELLLICKNKSSCVFDPSVLKIIGSSGTVYSYSPQLNLEPSFGSTTENNQVWGYLGFTIPTNETSLKLTLSENGQTYSLALE